MKSIQAKNLKCTKCKTLFPLDDMYSCEICEGILEVEYTYEIGNDLKTKKLSRSNLFTPIHKENVVTLGEGNTSLIRAKNLPELLGFNELYFKCEFNNPTGSFKDRPVSVGISKAIEYGYSKVIAASSGNGSASVAAYAAAANLEALILVPENTPKEKIIQTLSYGAKVMKIKGHYSNSYELSTKLAQKQDYYNITTTFYNPYTVEGDKVIGYEIFEDLKNVSADLIFVPIGAGPLLVGIYKGFRDYKMLCHQGGLPKMIGIQAAGNNPIVKAFENRVEKVNSEKNPNTIAGGIADGLVGYEKDGEYTLEYINKSGGFAMDVTDEEIMEAKSLLAYEEGLFVEPSGAAAFAGFIKSLKKNKISNYESAVIILTGHGLKDMLNVGIDENNPKLSTLSSVDEMINNE